MRTAVLLLVLAACSSCSPRSGSTASPGGAPTTDAAAATTAEVVRPPDDAASPVDPVAPPIDAPPAPPPIVLAPLSDLPALYAPLFTTRARFKYRWKWRIDPHDAEGGMPGFTTVTVACVVGPVEVFTVQAAVVARVATLACTQTPKPDDDSFPPMVATRWLATADGLRTTSELEDADDVRAAVAAGPPLMTARPVAMSKEEDVVDGDVTYHEWQKVFVKGKGWCSETGDAAYLGHLDRICFEPKRGLVAWNVEGREGPSEESYTLVK